MNKKDILKFNGTPGNVKINVSSGIAKIEGKNPKDLQYPPYEGRKDNMFIYYKGELMKKNYTEEEINFCMHEIMGSIKYN